MQTPIPFNCHLWKIENPAYTDWPVHLETVKVFEDDIHFERSIKKCSCGQLYFYEMIEMIDYENGEDPIYRTLIPITDINMGVELNSKSKFEITGFLSLRYDWPSENGFPRVYWHNRG